MRDLELDLPGSPEVKSNGLVEHMGLPIIVQW